MVKLSAKLIKRFYHIKVDASTVNLPYPLEAIREEGVQIVLLNDPEIYAEYAQYEYILDISEFIDCVKKINAVAS